MNKNKTRNDQQSVDLVPPKWIDEFDPQWKTEKYDYLVKKLTTILESSEHCPNHIIKKVPGYVFDYLTNPNAGKKPVKGRQSWLYYLHKNISSIDKIKAEELEEAIDYWQKNNYKTPTQIVTNLMRSYLCLTWEESHKEFVKDQILRVFGPIGQTQQNNIEMVQQKPAMINVRVDEKEKKMYLTTGDTCISLEFNSKL